MNIAALEVTGQTGAPVLDEMDLDPGVTALVVHQEAREQTLDHLGCGANPEHSRLPALQCARPLAERVGVRQQAAGPSKQILAF